MCDCLPSTPLSTFSLTKFRELGFCRTNQTPQNPQFPSFSNPKGSKLSPFTTLYPSGPRNVRSQSFSRRATEKSIEDLGLGFKEKGENLFDLERKPIGEETQNGFDPIKEANASLGESFDFSQSKGGSGDERFEGKNGDLMEGNEEGLKKIDGSVGIRKGRQVIKRSNILAKQVISIGSALSLGFVSQLWVNTNSWMVMFVEVRRNLLSGECERFLLDDVTQVGDVVLVEDESVIDDEYKIVGLETLVGYQVVTPGRRTIGKVRGYSFNINSGAVDALELDSFGISLIPSSLVSTYALFVEDVLEVVSDAIIVHEAAASRIHRLTKGFLDSQNVGTSIDELEEYTDFERPVRSNKHTRRSSGNQKFNPRKNNTNDDWDLPMDYF